MEEKKYKVTYGKYLYSIHPLYIIIRNALYIYYKGWISSTNSTHLLPQLWLKLKVDAKFILISETQKDMLLSNNEDDKKLINIIIEDKMKNEYGITTDYLF